MVYAFSPSMAVSTTTHPCGSSAPCTSTACYLFPPDVGALQEGSIGEAMCSSYRQQSHGWGNSSLSHRRDSHGEYYFCKLLRRIFYFFVSHAYCEYKEGPFATCMCITLDPPLACNAPPPCELVRRWRLTVACQPRRSLRTFHENETPPPNPKFGRRSERRQCAIVVLFINGSTYVVYLNICNCRYASKPRHASTSAASPATGDSTKPTAGATRSPLICGYVRIVSCERIFF